MAEFWVEEFRNEIIADIRALDDARRQRAGGPWSYEEALERTKDFYRQRITGFCTCHSISERERDQLLAVVEDMAGEPWRL
ncbi:MAG: hypothetical protein M0006_00660 [Magnetospirillum sp.]|nr:hypothetical protein [Magnetospirillum sp.]